MNILDLAAQEDDNVEFIDNVKFCLRWVVTENRPAELYVIKVDTWFGSRWCKFSGKALGLIGTWQTKLTLPPFVPHRVVWERKIRSTALRPNSNPPNPARRCDWRTSAVASRFRDRSKGFLRMVQWQIQAKRPWIPDGAHQ